MLDTGDDALSAAESSVRNFIRRFMLEADNGCR